MFEGNTEKGISCYTTRIKNSTIISNHIGLEQSFTSDSFKSHVTDNTIKNNDIGVKILNFGTYDVIVSNNTICNNSIYNVQNTSSRGAEFSNNCWCTEDTSEIESSVLHGVDDIELGLVTFTPVLYGCPDSTIDNVPPVVSDISAFTDEDIVLDIELNAVDPDSRQITYMVVTPASNGTVNVINNIVRYIPDQNFFGSDSFTVIANDGEDDSNTATISLSVNPVNDAPVAYNDTASVDEGNTVTILQNGQNSLLHNDTDIENDALIAMLVSNPTHGLLTVNSDGTFSYDHDGSNITSDSFIYKTNDGNLDSNIAIVDISINPVNDNSPTDITLSKNSIQENITGAHIGLLIPTDLDLPYDSHTFELVDGFGDTNNSDFTVVDEHLYSITSFDYEEQQTLSIRLKVIDENNQSFEKTFMINVINLNDINITSEVKNSYCSNSSGSGQITITSVTNTSGALTYNWSATNGGVVPLGQENSPYLKNLRDGIYHLTITDDHFSYNESFEISLLPQFDDLSICRVSSDDSGVTKNRIYLNNKGNYNVAFYEILRESNIANVYVSIATIASTENSFLDESSNNESQSYNYKVRSIDKCGITSPSSEFHKTILLQSSIAVDGTVNLNWSDYEGIDFDTYKIWRCENQGAFQIIDFVSANSNSYNDTTANVSDNTYKYYISIEVDSCFNGAAKQETTGTAEIKSNLQNISENDVSSTEVFIHPNPSSSNLNVELRTGTNFIKGEIFNAIGKKIMGTKETFFSIEYLPSSIYFIKIYTSEGITTRKFIKE